MTHPIALYLSFQASTYSYYHKDDVIVSNDRSGTSGGSYLYTIAFLNHPPFIFNQGCVGIYINVLYLYFQECTLFVEHYHYHVVV